MKTKKKRSSRSAVEMKTKLRTGTEKPKAVVVTNLIGGGIAIGGGPSGYVYDFHKRFET